MKRDYYEILEISQQANERDIKIAYRRLAHEFHPDKNPGNVIAEEKFKEATEAYSVLIDSKKRERYDQFGHQGLENTEETQFSTNLEDIFGNIFGDIFGNKKNKNRGQKGTDLRYVMSISFEEAAFGVEHEIKIKCKEKCSLCNGTGCKAGAQLTSCKACEGNGEIRISQGFFTVTQTCPSCFGSGQLNKNPCIDCKGSGFQDSEKNVTVKIQAGIEDGMKIKFIGKGNSGTAGGRYGDLYVIISIKNHTIFKRDGCNIICDMPISFTQAALGASIEVPTLYGKTALEIPAGTQTGNIFKLDGKGIPNLHVDSNKKGDQFVRVTIETPKRLTLDQKNALKSFADLIDENNSPSQKKFIDKVKELFG